MTDAHLIRCVWTGSTFEPASGFMRAQAAKAFGDGEVVLLAVVNERSMRSHRHYFAALHDAWASLPERLADMPYSVSSEALRKHALIASGFADVMTIDAGSTAAAMRVAAGLRSVHRDYCVVKVQGPVVRVFTAQSQSVKAMGNKEFQRSKTLVLEWVDGLLRGEAA
jgi:hypothetical protein